MGFDIHGINPQIKDVEKEFGVYFQNNVWYWRPLWDYVCLVCEDIMSLEHVIAGHSNSGTEIPEEITSKMAMNLSIEIALGNHKRYEEEYIIKMKELPLEDCEICGATGFRTEPPECGPGSIPCNGCKSKGKRPNFQTNYYFSTENLEDFTEFLENSGGISIC